MKTTEFELPSLKRRLREAENTILRLRDRNRFLMEQNTLFYNRIKNWEE